MRDLEECDVQADLDRLEGAARRGAAEFYAVVHCIAEGVPMPRQALGRQAGRTFALEGWTLDAARHLGAIAGHDPQHIEEGYRSERQQTRLRF